MSRTSAPLPPKVQRALLAFKALYDNHLAAEPSPADQTHQPPGAIFKSGDEDLFAEDVSFRDPLMHVTGLNDYKMQFAGLHGMFQNITLDVLSTSYGEGRPTIGVHAGQPVEMITIDANATYKVNRFMQVTIRQVTKLEINEAGKIQSHEDLWSWADMIEGLPLIGQLYRKVQPIAGRLVSAGLNRMYAYRAGVGLRGAAMNTNTIHAAYHPIESQRLSQKRGGDGHISSGDAVDDEVVAQGGRKMARGEHKGAGKKSAAGAADDRKEL